MASYTYQLTMRTGPTPGRIVMLGEGEFMIGRDPASSFAISDPEVSRHHARLTFQSGFYVLEDLNSTNGTFVNGRRLVGQYVMQSGDVINLGENITLIYESTPYDPDVTVASTAVFPQPEENKTFSPFPQTSRPAPAGQQIPATPPPTYTGQVPASPDDFEPMPPAKPRSRSLPWVLASCGCLTIVCLIVVAALFYIDSQNLWCSAFPFIPGCP